MTSEYRSITRIVSARLSPFSTEDDFKSEMPIELPPSDAIAASKLTSLAMLKAAYTIGGVKHKLQVILGKILYRNNISVIKGIRHGYYLPQAETIINTMSLKLS